MKLLSFVLALALAQGALSACAADNCARAVTGTRTGKMPDVTSRMKDCSSFVLVTVTPATSTITATATVTTTVTLGEVAKRQAAVLEPRQVTVTPSSVPIYASACSGTARYSSACSCWGITATTTTAPNPVTTTTATVTATVSVCPAGDTECRTSCFNLQTNPGNCGACGNACAAGATCQSGACSTVPGTCPSYTASCFDTIRGVLASNSIASPQLVGYRIESALLGITTPSDFLATLGTDPCKVYTDPTENAYCVQLLADSHFVGQLTDITNGLLSSFQSCASVYATGGPDYQIIVSDPNNATCTGQGSFKRHEKRTFGARENGGLPRSMLEAIEEYGITPAAPLLGPLKSSHLQLTRKQLSTCSRTRTCFETCPDCRDQQTYCGATANVIATTVCGSLAAIANAGVAVLAGSACGAACAPLGPGAVACAAFCARAAGGLSAVAVAAACAVLRNAICDPLTQRCANCNSANNGICNPSSTQCCAGETGTACGVNCCCCPRCYAPGGINCACTAAPC